MNIEQLALEAGLVYQGHEWCDADRKQIGRFAALVRNAALEEAAAECSSLWRIDGQFTADEFADAIRSMKVKT